MHEIEKIVSDYDFDGIKEYAEEHYKDEFSKLQYMAIFGGSELIKNV